MAEIAPGHAAAADQLFAHRLSIGALLLLIVPNAVYTTEDSDNVAGRIK